MSNYRYKCFTNPLIPFFRSNEAETEEIGKLVSISGFLEYCALSSHHKDLDEAEGGVCTLLSSMLISILIFFFLL